MSENTGDDRQPMTIRMFPDYAHTVLWLDQPIRYSATGLSQGLVEELQVWEQSYYDSLTDDIVWISDAAASAFTAEGARLTHGVSAEVGPRFVVEFASYEVGAGTVCVRAESPAENPAAENAFTELADKIVAEEQKAAERRRDGEGKWIAYAPLSGTVFDPNSHSRRPSSGTD